ncbi:MAG: peptidoglycan DD-metalloendopeptidase family protein [Actinomycetia bacterium]|nr:peptidoglycan DD-metalloendopeptidase family protein [Actinomycetes bacterium]
MRHHLPPRLILPLLVLTLITVVPVSASAQSKGDVENAKSAADRRYQELLDADQILEEGLEDLERIQGKIYDLEYRIDKLESALVEYGNNSDALQERARLIVLEAYTSGGRNLVTAAFGTKDIQDLITSQALFDAATTRDLNQLDQLSAVSRQMERLNDDLGIKEAEVQALRVEQESVVAHLEEDRATADALAAEAKKNYADVYARYKAEQARRAAAAAAAAAAKASASRSSGGSSGGGSSRAAAGVPAATAGVNCPLPNGSSFIDTWGYPRSGGRTHKGTDMIAGYGSTLVAMMSGTVRLNYHSLGGRQLYIYGNDGITYYYAHLSSYAAGLSNGQSVSQGQGVGFVGSTGNATTNVLHLGMIVGGQYVNPYPTVRQAC